MQDLPWVSHVFSSERKVSWRTWESMLARMKCSPQEFFVEHIIDDWKLMSPNFAEINVCPPPPRTCANWIWIELRTGSWGGVQIVNSHICIGHPPHLDYASILFLTRNYKTKRCARVWCSVQGNAMQRSLEMCAKPDICTPSLLLLLQIRLEECFVGETWIFVSSATCKCKNQTKFCMHMQCWRAN